MIYYTTYESPIGRLYLLEKEGFLTEIALVHSTQETQKETDFLITVIKQLDEYFAGKRKVFEFPIMPEGTQFQKKVWKELLNIPYGTTCSYKQIAEKIGNPKAYRAVGMANNKNPIMIVVPCHRVVGTNGSLVGYAGGLDIKSKLLLLEETGIEWKK